MSDFDPRTQTFVLLAADGITEIPVSVEDVNEFYQVNAKVVMNFGPQIGASFIMLLVFLCLSVKITSFKLTHWVHITALIVNTVRLVLVALFYMGNWTDFYAIFTDDYSHIVDQDFRMSIAGEVSSLCVFILVQLALSLQAWAVVSLLSDWWKWLFLALSGVVSLVAVAFRFAAAVVQIQAILAVRIVEPAWLVESGAYLGAASIFYYCALFNGKLVGHLIQNRGVLPSISGLSAMEVLVITNGLLMIIPGIFAGFAWNQWRELGAGSLILTCVIVFLPLGTLIAQRVAVPQSYYAKTQESGNTNLSSWPLKSQSDHGNNPHDRSTVTSHVEATSSRSREPFTDPIDHELRQIDSDDAEKGGVRVNREIERREERI